MPETRRTAALLFATLLACSAYVHQHGGWNQNSRLDLLHALVGRGTLAIDRYHSNTDDKARVGAHHYSEKAPGGALLALPAFAAAAGVLRAAGVGLDSPAGWKVSSWVATAGSVGLLTAGAAVLFFSLLVPRVGERAAGLSTLALFLGSLPFPYATALFSHGAVMALLFAALWALDRRERGGEPRLDLVAGLCCGLAAASEYPAALASGGVFLAVAGLGPRAALRFAAGAAGPVLLVPLYNWAVTGSPLTMTYLYSVVSPEHRIGFFGATSPRLDAAWQLLFGPYRGLFVFSPVLLASFAGLPALRRESPRLFWLAIGVPAALLAYVSGFFAWHAGWAFGPRYLAAAVPFLALPAGLGLAARPRLGVALGGFSVLLVTAATLVDVMPPQDVLCPLVDYYPGRLLAGRLAPNLGLVAGLGPLGSLLPFYALVCAATWALARRPGAAPTP